MANCASMPSRNCGCETLWELFSNLEAKKAGVGWFFFLLGLVLVVVCAS